MTLQHPGRPPRPHQPALSAAPRLFTSSLQVVKSADVIFIAVKPQYVSVVLQEVGAGPLVPLHDSVAAGCCPFHVCAAPALKRHSAGRRGAGATEGCIPG